MTCFPCRFLQGLTFEAPAGIWICNDPCHSRHEQVQDALLSVFSVFHSPCAFLPAVHKPPLRTYLSSLQISGTHMYNEI